MIGASEGNSETLGLSLSRETRLSIPWKEFAADLADAAVQFWLKGPLDAASTGISAIFHAIAGTRLEQSPGEKVWALATLGFAWALDQVKEDKDVDAESLKKILKEAIARAQVEAEGSGVFVPIGFLDRPTTLPLYQSLRDAVVEESQQFHLSTAGNPNATKFRIDSAFERAIFEIWAKNIDTYKSIEALLCTPLVKSAEQSIAWASYRKRLIFEFEVRPVFGQEERKISLSQLYIPLRGYWRKLEFDKATYSANDDLPKRNNIDTIDNALHSWIADAPPSDWLRLIGGGPGSGKSTTLRCFARKLADMPDWRPLFIPLQHIDFESDLRESINRYFTDQSGGAFAHPPLSRTAAEDGPPLILLFDGLDEVSAPNEAAKEIVATFANRLSSLVASLQGPNGSPVRVVVTGRMPAFQAAKRYLTPPPEGSIETYGFVGLPKRSDEIDDLWYLDQRPAWWRQYALLTDEICDLPPAFSSKKLAGITHEPLLCYLLALAGYATAHWEEAAENQNRIYSALMDSVYERGWGEGVTKRRGPGQGLTHPDFDLLMKTIALAAWFGGDSRVATQDNFEEAVKLMGADDAWNEFQKDNGPDVANLAMNFYLKSSEREQRGFEFTHKSFGEYLTARALISIAFEVSALAKRRLDHALGDWARATRTGSVTREILQFMRDEVRLLTAVGGSAQRISDISDMKKSFINMIDAVNDDGFPIVVPVARWRTMEGEQYNSEIAAWAVLNSCAKALGASAGQEQAMIRLKDRGMFGLGGIISRLSASRGSLLHQCLSYLDASRAILFSVDINDGDLEGSNFRMAIFLNARISGSNWKNSDLGDIAFMSSKLKKVDFEGSNLTGARFRDVELEDTSLSNANLDNCEVGRNTLMLTDPVIFEELAASISVVDWDSEKDLLDPGRLARVDALIKRGQRGAGHKS